MDYYLTVSKYFDVMIDSGAFSAHNSGAEITLDEYIKSCKEYYHNRCWQYVQLDKIKNPDISTKQLDAMVSAGLTPMPVLTAGMDFNKMKDYVSINECVCVAGGVGGLDKYTYYRYQKAFEASGGKAKIHALGFLRFPDIYRLPIYSGDSSSFANGTKYGLAAMYSPRRGPFKIIERSHLAKLNPERFYRSLTKECRLFLEKCNIDYFKLVPEDRFMTGSISVPAVLNVLAYVNYMMASAAYNRKVFLAVSSVGWLFLIAIVFKSVKNKLIDYEAVVKEYLFLNDLHKKNPKEANEVLNNVLHNCKARL